jgi:hypothetical protein
MISRYKACLMAATAAWIVVGVAASAATIQGQVEAAGNAVSGSAVILWAASTSAPQQVAQVQSGSDGKFTFPAYPVPTGNPVYYVVASGGTPAANKAAGNNPGLSFISVLGTNPPGQITVNEFTTIASVWTNAQFITGTAIQGTPLGLSVAAGNVPDFVDLATGGWGGAIQAALNSTETPTMANFATVASLLAGCATEVTANACNALFSAATPPSGAAPTNTLTAAEAIAKNAGYEPRRVFALLDAFYPVPAGKNLRHTPFLPYLSVAPSSWVLPLKFTGGGVDGPGKIMFDSKGDAWTGANFVIGSQGRDALWDGNMAEFAPNGSPLSPITTGFAGGGLQGPGFGTAIDANDRVWITSTSGRTISLFNHNGHPISPPSGYNFGGRLGMVQGIIVTPNGDVWALDFGKDKIIYMPQGDPRKVKFFCETPAGKNAKDNPCKLSGPFHLAIDQQNRIWISNAIGDSVTRISANDPSKVDVFKTGGFSGKGMGIDSQGNVWVTNTVGGGFPLDVKLHLLALKETGRASDINLAIVNWLVTHPGSATVTGFRPDGTRLPGSPYKGGGSLWGAWAVAIDGNDNVWISNFAPGGGITELCGARTHTCPAGMKTGDPISPPGGFVGGGMMMLTDVAIDPAGDVWVADNWQTFTACYGKANEADSTQCGGNGLTVFYGLAKPVRIPLIGPPRAP